MLSRSIILASFVFFFLAHSAIAQDSTWTPPPPTPPVNLESAVAAMAWDSTASVLLVSVPSRSSENVQREKEDLEDQRSKLRAELENQKSMQERAEAYQKLKKFEVESLKTRVDLAGKEKNKEQKKLLQKQ